MGERSGCRPFPVNEIGHLNRRRQKKNADLGAIALRWVPCCAALVAVLSSTVTLLC